MLPYHLLAKVKLSETSKLPRNSGVYYAVGAKTNTLYYVGKAVNLKGRWQKHEHRKDLERLHEPIVLHYRKLPFYSIRNVEAEEIKRYRPPINNRNETTKFSLGVWLDRWLPLLTLFCLSVALALVLHWLAGVTVGGIGMMAYQIWGY